jgi:hypothetical protein
MKRRPFNLNKAFGVEIEFICPPNTDRNEVARFIGRKFDELDRTSSYNIVCGSYSRNNGYDANSWYMKTDSTVHPNRRQSRNQMQGGNELVSPKLVGMDGFKQLNIVLGVMSDLGCEVNKSCGLHVHHDITDVRNNTESHSATTIRKASKTITNLILLVSRWERFIFMMLPKSRRPRSMGHGCGEKSTWCLPVSDRFDNTFTTHFDSGIPKIRMNLSKRVSRITRMLTERSARFQHCRTVGLNFYKFWIQGSVEFRYGGGSLSYEKIMNWVVFTQAFVNTAKDTNSISHLYESPYGDSTSLNRGVDWMKRNLGMVGATDTNPVEQYTEDYDIDVRGCILTVDEDATQAHRLVAEASTWVNRRMREMN